MIRKIYLIICFSIILSLGACGKKDKEPEEIVVGNGGNQIDIDSINAPGGEADNEESTLEIGKEHSDRIVIVINWDKIVINDDECNDIEGMKEQIVRSGCKRIDLQHTDASKETLDEVINILKDIEKTLGIDVNYN